MFQGSTPKIRLTPPFDARLCSLIRVAFVTGREREVVLTKEVRQSEIMHEYVTIPITQEETRLMEGLVVLEVRARMMNGEVVTFVPEPVVMAELIDEAMV